MRHYRNILFLIISSLSLYAFSIDNVYEFNNRAESSIITDPSSTIYYSNKSISENVDFEIKDEYIKSLYFISRSYLELDESDLSYYYIKEAYSFLNRERYYYPDYEFYIYTARLFLDQKRYNELDSLISNEVVVNNINSETLTLFNLFKIEELVDKGSNEAVSNINQLIEIGNSVTNRDIAAEIFLFIGNYYIRVSDNQRALTFLRKAAEVTTSEYSVYSQITLGSLSNSISTLKNAYLNSQSFNNNDLTLLALNTLSNEFERLGDYKNQVRILEDINILNSQHSSFLLNQNKKIRDYGFEIEKISIELEDSRNRLEIYFYIIISLALVSILLIISISIQSIRNRSINT